MDPINKLNLNMKKHLAALVVLADTICLFAASEPQVGPPFTPYHPQSVPDVGNTLLFLGLALFALGTYLSRSKRV